MLPVLLIVGAVVIVVGVVNAHAAQASRPAEAPAPLPLPAETPAPTAPAPAPASKAPRDASAAAPVQTPAPTPMYPVGLEAKLGDKSATIIKAWVDAQGVPQYTVTLRALGLQFNKVVDEPFLRDFIARELKAPLELGQAFPAGLELYRNGQGGVIERAEKGAGGGWTYTIRGWPNAVGQAQLMDILGR